MQRVKKETSKYEVPVYDRFREIVAFVKYNNNLDTWNGSKMTYGSTGRHKGLTQLENGNDSLFMVWTIKERKITVGL